MKPNLFDKKGRFLFFFFLFQSCGLSFFQLLSFLSNAPSFFIIFLFFEGFSIHVSSFTQDSSRLISSLVSLQKFVLLQCYMYCRINYASTPPLSIISYRTIQPNPNLTQLNPTRKTPILLLIILLHSL